MKASELRIGNYVTIDNPISWLKLKNIPLLVTAVNEKMDKFDSESFPHSDGTIKLKSEYDTYGQFSQFIAPIELTEDWLFKLGFTNDENESWFWSFDFNDKQETFKIFPLTAGGEPMGLWGIVGCPQLVKKIEFVHQLQNVYFSLIGQELELK